MEEALMKSGDFPNVAIKPGTTEHAATGEAVEIPDGARPGDALSLETEETEQVPAEAENEAENGSDCVEQDTREKLVADVWALFKCCEEGEPLVNSVLSLLDRQADITFRYCQEDYEAMSDYMEGKISALRDKCDNLTAQLHHAQACPDCDCCGWIERIDGLEESVKTLCGEVNALRDSKHIDKDALQLALVRFATDWMAAAGHIQEQRTIIYHVEKIAELIEGAKQ